MLSKIDVEKFNTLIETNALISLNDTDLASLLTRILESAARLCGAEASCLLRINRETRELYVEVSSRAAETEGKPRRIKMGEGIAGWVAVHNKPLILDDAGTDERFLNDTVHELGLSSKAVLAVPIQVKDECLGVVELAGKKNGKRFDKEDLKWLEISAAQAGIVIANAENTRDKPKQGKAAAIVSKSAVIQEKLDIVERVAGTDAPVLILGESGAGKEFFAERIHLKSPRGEKRFVKVNCAAIPKELLESEIFGHVKGAFAGAFADRRGYFEIADGGTIFLNEICELPPALQMKLLRVVQEGTFEKLGSSDRVSVDVRILAATSGDIEKRVEKGEFQSDLYYRLNTFPLLIPPLRQRPEDIPALADFFLRKFTEEIHNPFDGFSEEAMEALVSYPWPGNITELEHCIERACVIGKGKKIEAEDLFLKTRRSRGIETRGSRDLKAAENIFRARYIKQILEEHNWNQTETARALDIQRTYLSRLIKKLEISNHKE